MFSRAEKPLKSQLVRKFTLQNSYFKDWWRCLGLGSFDLGVVGWFTGRRHGLYALERPFLGVCGTATLQS